VFGLGLVLGAVPARAGEPVEVEGTKVKVTSKNEAGHEHSEIYDLSKPPQYEEVIALLKKGRVVELAKQEPVNIMAISWDLGLWTLAVFVLLFAVLKKAAWGPILEGLQRREENIHSALAEAQKGREEAKALREQLQKELDRAGDSVREILDEGRRSAQRLTEEMLAKTRAEIQTERDRLRREIDVARDQALQEIWSQAAQLATLVSAKTIRKQLSPEDHRRLVDEALTEMRGAVGDLRREVWGSKA